jgi:hypothetical protein
VARPQQADDLQGGDIAQIVGRIEGRFRDLSLSGGVQALGHALHLLHIGLQQLIGIEADVVEQILRLLIHALLLLSAEQVPCQAADQYPGEARRDRRASQFEGCRPPADAGRQHGRAIQQRERRHQPGRGGHLLQAQPGGGRDKLLAEHQKPEAQQQQPGHPP